MPDQPQIPRMVINDHQALGRLMIKWATEHDTRPKDLPEFLNATAGIIQQPLPDWIKGLQFVQSNMEVLMIRLPPAELVKDTLAFIANNSGRYPLPAFYESHIVHGDPSSQRDLFEFRVGDYTIAHCV